MTDSVSAADEPLPDDVVPPEDEPATRSRPSRKPDNPQETPNSLTDVSPTGNGFDSTTQHIVNMTRLYPFRALFTSYAQIRFPQRRKLESKVEALIDANPRFYWFVRVFDMAFVGVLCLLIVGALAGNIYAVFIR